MINMLRINANTTRRQHLEEEGKTIPQKCYKNSTKLHHQKNNMQSTQTRRSTL